MEKQSLAGWLGKVLVGQHRLLLIVALVVAGCSLPISNRLNLDWAVEGMFPPGDPLVESYRKLQERFGGNDICLAVYRDPQLWEASGIGLERLEQVSNRLAKVDGVQAVLSLAELHSILQKLRGPMAFLSPKQDKTPPLLDPNDKLAQAFSSVFEGYTHQKDSEYVAIACLLGTSREVSETEDNEQLEKQVATRGPSNHTETLEAIRAVMETLPEPATEGFVTGEPVLVAEGFKMVERDGFRLGVTSSVLVSIVLLVCFRSLRWTLIPLLVVHWSLLITKAILVLFRLDLTMISSTLTAIVTVIGVATTMHLLLRFQERRRKGRSRAEAMQETFAALLAPIFWACVTDAVGFCALLTAEVGPVRDFGVMMAIGSMSVFAAIAVLVPGLALVGSYDTDPSTPKLDFLVRLWLRRVLEFCLARRTLGLCVLALLFVFGVVGSLRMQVETDFTKNFERGSPLVQGFEVIERELGGAGVWDVMLAAPKSIGSAYVEQVLALEQELRSVTVSTADGEARLTKVLSIADAVKAAEAGTVIAALPVAARLQGMKAAMPEFTGALLTKDVDQQGLRWLRVMLRSQEQQPAAAKTELVQRVKEKLSEFTRRSEWKEQFQDEPSRSEVAGYHVMLSSLVASVIKDQWQCFFVATLGIYIVMVLATRSFLLGLATLIPNALPIMLVLGCMGWAGTKANMGVAMIAAVSLGLSIDSSIHYLLHYKRRLRAGNTPRKAIRSAQENVGLAVVLATAALIAGFISLCMSEFVPTVVFGTLASLTMLGGLLGNLVMLPLLIARK